MLHYIVAASAWRPGLRVSSRRPLAVCYSAAAPDQRHEHTRNAGVRRSPSTIATNQPFLRPALADSNCR